MAFGNTQTITIDDTELTLERVFTGSTTGLFKSSDSATSIEVTPAVSRDGRQHRVARLRQKKTTTDPLVGSTNVRVEDFMSLNVNRPSDGYTDAEILKQATGFIAWLTANSNANLIKLIGGEN